MLVGMGTMTGCAEAVPPAVPPIDSDDAGVADVTAQFAGIWELVGIERHNVNGELLSADTVDRSGYIMYDPAGYMGVVIQQGGRQSFASDDPTPEEAQEAFQTYTSYFGTFTVNAVASEVTHLLRGSLNPNGAGSDYVRTFEFSGDRLTLQPPISPAGIQSRLTWQRVPDLLELTPEYQRFIGFWEIDSIERRTESGESVPANQYAEGFLQYAASGHMAVHLMRPERRPPEGAQATAEEALAAMRTYTSYFGPVSLHETDGYIVHHRIGHANPSAIGTDAQRFYELSDNQLILKPPPTTVDGKVVQSALTWTRVSQ